MSASLMKSKLVSLKFELPQPRPEKQPPGEGEAPRISFIAGRNRRWRTKKELRQQFDGR